MATQPWTPAALGALDRIRWDFLDAAAVTASAGKVSQVANKGSLGSAANLLQATAGRQPSYASGVLTTDGSQQFLATNTVAYGSIFAGLQTGLFYGIVKFNGGIVWFKHEGILTDRLGLEGSARVDWPNDGAGSIRNFSPNLTTSRIILVQKTATTLSVRINGAVVASAASTQSNSNFTKPIALGANNAAGELPAAIELRGALGLIDDVSLDTVQRVEGWLAWRMSGAGDASYVANLPADHPYKTAGPTVTVADPAISAALAATEAADTAALAAASTNRSSVTATEASDTAAASVAASTPAALTASEASDTAGLSASARFLAALSASEGIDTAGIGLTATTPAALQAREAADGASIRIGRREAAALLNAM